MRDDISKGRGRLLSRRAFLQRAAAGLGAITLPAYGVFPRESVSHAEVPSRAKDWSALRARLSGALVLPDDAAYDDVRVPFNTIYDTRLPAAVAQCKQPSDVQACIDFARQRGVRVAARSGGHSYGGYCVPGHGLLIDVGPMHRVGVGAGGATVVGAGARLRDVYTGVAAAGRCLPAGTSPSVGIAGLTLGGGIGILSRKYGLTCDHLSATEIILADGSRKTLSAQENEDLFWAIRGGGGGNFGIVTSFTFRTTPAPSEVTVFRLSFAPGTVAQVLYAWQDWMLHPPPPNELWSNCRVYAGSPPRARVGGSFVGSASRAQGFLNDLVKRVKAAGAGGPIEAQVRSMGYLDAVLGSGGQTRKAFVASSRIVSRPMEDTQPIAALLAQYEGLTVLFDGLGGAVSQVAPHATAFPHRSAIATVQINKETTLEDWRDARREVSQIRFALKALCGGGAYVNYIDPAMADWATASYGANLPRLRRIAHRVDPDGFFAFAQGIPRS